ncbi:MAG: hypothetical protein WKG01_17225 [Kofleriaceae bacterium]
MTTSDDILSLLTGASPRKLLEDLARIGVALAKHDRLRPEVEIFLTSGQLIKGRIVSVADDREGAVALLQVGGSADAPAVTFVRCNHMAAVGVVDASLLVRSPIIDTPVPSKLELNRQVAARAEDLATAVGRALPLELGGATELDDDGRRAIFSVLPLVVEVLAAIASDKMGQDALKHLDGVELGSAQSGEVYKTGKKLVIRAPKLVTELYTQQTLRRAIEKLL